MDADIETARGRVSERTHGVKALDVADVLVDEQPQLLGQRVGSTAAAGARDERHEDWKAV